MNNSENFFDMQAIQVKEAFAQDLATDNWQVKKLLYLQPELFWFRGHFPVQAVLPGVAQVNWVMEEAQKHLATQLVFVGFDRIKFQKPLQPDQNVVMQLDWDQSKQALNFFFTLVGQGQISDWPEQEGIPVSSGKVRFKCE